jgi:hypothetical protein
MRERTTEIKTSQIRDQESALQRIGSAQPRQPAAFNIGPQKGRTTSRFCYLPGHLNVCARSIVGAPARRYAGQNPEVTLPSIPEHT